MMRVVSPSKFYSNAPSVIFSTPRIPLQKPPLLPPLHRLSLTKKVLRLCENMRQFWIRNLIKWTRRSKNGFLTVFHPRNSKFSRNRRRRFRCVSHRIWLRLTTVSSIPACSAFFIVIYSSYLLYISVHSLLCRPLRFGIQQSDIWRNGMGFCFLRTLSIHMCWLHLQKSKSCVCNCGGGSARDYEGDLSILHEETHCHHNTHSNRFD